MSIQDLAARDAVTVERQSRLLEAAVVVWSVFTLLHLLTGHLWWGWAISDSGPTAFLLIMPVLLIAAVAVLRRRLIWTAPLLASFLTHLPQSDLGKQFGPSCGRVASGEALSILTWNTQFWGEKQDGDVIGAQLAKARPDVAVLQEVQLTVRKMIVGYTPPDFPTDLYSTILRKGELAIATNKRVLADNRTQLDTPHLWADIAGTDGRVLRIINTHTPLHLSLSYKPGDGDFFDFIRTRFQIRNADLAGLRRLIEDSPHPVAVLGDFNATQSMAPFRWAVGGPCDSVAAAGLQNSSTWAIAGLQIWRPDYVLTSPEIGAVAHEVLPLGDVSDHRAIQIMLPF